MTSWRLSEAVKGILLQALHVCLIGNKPERKKWYFRNEWKEAMTDDAIKVAHR